MAKQNYDNRIIFLRRFTQHMIRNYVRDEISKHKIETEKLRRKFSIEPSAPHPPSQLKSTTHRLSEPAKSFQNPNKSIKQLLRNPKQQKRGFGMSKITPLINDPSVQLIECPGPNKNVLVKRRNVMNITRVLLSQLEIKNIVENFANQAKIPLVGGILKAAVNNLVISAVISEFAGSRFIINKMTPYTLIE
jgi:hypothetical protein